MENLLNLAREAGLNPKWVAGTQGGEYHASCPECGGKDRFYIQPSRKQRNCLGYYCCRQCNIKGDTIEFGRKFRGFTFNEALNHAQATIQPSKSFPFLDNNERMHLPKVPKKLSNQWMEQATNIVDVANRNLLKLPERLMYLRSRGLPIDAVKKYMFGWNAVDKQINGSDWGLEKDKIWLPKGFIIPLFRDGKVVGLKIRRSEWFEGDKFPKYVAVSGSINGLNIIGETKNRDVMLVVESEFDAYAAHYLAGDFLFCVAMGGSSKDTDILTDYLAKKIKHLLICYDNDDAGKISFNKWLSRYSHAKRFPTPIGKDIGQAIELGLDIRRWISEGLSVSETASILPISKEEESDHYEDKWSNDAQVIIEWFCRYLNYLSKTRDIDLYKKYEGDIAKGPSGACASELIKELKIMKQLVDNQIIL